MDLRRGLGRSLRLIRKAKGVAQQDLSDVVARSYISYVERGVKNPTLEKLDELARAMQVHPLTVLTVAYMPHLSEQELANLLDRVSREVKSVLIRPEVGSARKARAR